MMIYNRFTVIAAVGLLPLISQANNAAVPEVGRKVYESICIACHAPANVMVSAPKLGDVSDWNERLAREKGRFDSLVDNAVNGFGAMPPKGGHQELSRDQIRQAIKYMVTPRNPAEPVSHK